MHPDRANANCNRAKIFLIAVYFSHRPVFPYENLRLCRESLMLSEYHQNKLELSVILSISKILRMTLDGSVGPTGRFVCDYMRILLDMLMLDWHF
jgi:hypothetical protein